MNRLVRKEPEAFKLFFDEYFPRVYRFCRSRVGDDAWEDIAQEAMIKAVNALASYKGEASLYTWLCQISRNEIVNWYRKNKRVVHISLEFDQDERNIVDSVMNEEVSSADNIHTQRIVELILDSLPANYGSILEMKYLAGMSVGEIAKTLGTGEVAVQSVLARARKAFRRSYDELAAHG